MRNNLEDKTPTVTIGIVTYNRPDLLREAVLSILNQTYGNFELLIGNDYIKTPVTFDTLGINPNPRVKILNYSSNLGEIDNMNNNTADRAPIIGPINGIKLNIPAITPTRII